MNKRVPTKRFGRTELQMPVLSCGGMRFKQSWDDLSFEEVEEKVQLNAEETVRAGFDFGINHIETARGYGTSEVQLGHFIHQFPREELILQTKIIPWNNDDISMLPDFEKSLNRLNTEYVDLLSIHGLNTPQMLEDVLRKGGPMDEIRQLQRDGRVRHVGFSTHAGPESVIPAIESGEFDYVNLHWYYVYHPMRWSMVEAAAKADLGVLLISPNDKGGRLYNPSEKMRKICEPLTAMQWHDLYCLQHPEVHTLSIGAANPADFEQHVDAVTRFWEEKDLVQKIEGELNAAIDEVFGREWRTHFFEGLPPYYKAPSEINITEILRLWTLYKGLDMHDFAKARYNLLGNGGHWFPGQTAEKLDEFDWSCLRDNRFKAQIPGMLKEAHDALAGEEVSRASQA